MNKNDESGCAFPCNELNGDGTHYFTHSGMSLRDYFAAKTLQGLCANPGGPFQANGTCGWSIVNCTVDQIAGEAYGLADAMIKARGAQ